jgi:hypothetical protein
MRTMVLLVLLVVVFLSGTTSVTNIVIVNHTGIDYAYDNNVIGGDYSYDYGPYIDENYDYSYDYGPYI